MNHDIAGLCPSILMQPILAIYHSIPQGRRFQQFLFFLMFYYLFICAEASC